MRLRKGNWSVDLETTGISRSRSAYSTHTRPILLLLLANGRIERSVYERDTKSRGEEWISIGRRLVDEAGLREDDKISSRR